MVEIIDFSKAKNSVKNRKKSSSTLCRNGHHKWVVSKKKQFDVKQGKLITIYICSRCNKQKVLAE